MPAPTPLAARGPVPRHAASLVLIRQGAAGLEVLMGRRPRKSAFAPDVFVFPGGRVEPADYDAAPLRMLDPDCVRRTGAAPRLAHALAAAALRETEEETGVVMPNDHRALRLIARAITPSNSPIRFHARFFLAEAAAAVGEHADSAELTDLAYRTVAETETLPLMDVTQAVLAALPTGVGAEPAPFLYGYRRGKPYWRTLD
jgi:8-oxo-dGTP pyrophosphatase MutT (NUDIX family)